MLEGPSRIGHYFRAEYRTASGAGVAEESGPIIRPDCRMHQWSIRYSPKSDGSGIISVQLDDHVHSLPVAAEHRKLGATFDRFGLFNVQAGGHCVDIALDDVTSTTKRK
jgi:hypothetical protein